MQALGNCVEDPLRLRSAKYVAMYFEYCWLIFRQRMLYENSSDKIIARNKNSSFYEPRRAKKLPSSMRNMSRFRSSCACANYRSGLCSSVIHSAVAYDSVSGQWRSLSDCLDAQADLGLRCLYMPGHVFAWGDPYEHQITYSILEVSILYKSLAGRYRPVRVADGPITASYRFMKNASWVDTSNYEQLIDRMYVAELQQNKAHHL